MVFLSSNLPASFAYALKHTWECWISAMQCVRAYLLTKTQWCLCLYSQGREQWLKAIWSQCWDINGGMRSLQLLVVLFMQIFLEVSHTNNEKAQSSSYDSANYKQCWTCARNRREVKIYEADLEMKENNRNYNKMKEIIAQDMKTDLKTLVNRKPPLT